MLEQISYLKLYSCLQTFVSQHTALKQRRDKDYIIKEFNIFLNKRGLEKVLKEERIYQKALILISNRHDLYPKFKELSDKMGLSKADIETIFNIASAKSLPRLITKHSSISTFIKTFKLLESKQVSI